MKYHVVAFFEANVLKEFLVLCVEEWYLHNDNMMVILKFQSNAD